MMALDLPFKYHVIEYSELWSSEPIKFINEALKTSFRADAFEIKTQTETKGTFFRCSQTNVTVGFTLLFCDEPCSVDIFKLDIDGNADGIHERLKMDSCNILLVENHPKALFRLSRKMTSLSVISVAEDTGLSSEIPVDELKCIINDNYLNNSDKIQELSDKFYNESVLQIDNFFTDEYHSSQLKSISSIRVGPADYRNFTIESESSEMVKFFNSPPFIRWLSNLTGLPLLHPAVPIYTRSLNAAGDYQILHGNYSEPLGLDIIYSFTEWSEDVCGRIHYLNAEGVEIYQVVPRSNSLCIVFRTEGSVRFTENVKGFPEGPPLKQIIGIYSVADELPTSQ